MSRTESRNLARTSLAVLAAMGLIWALFSTGPHYGVVNAQASSTSCGSEIHWVNPDNDTTTEISAKSDKDTRYHLVAWVNEVPDDAAVDFLFAGNQIASTSSNTIEQVGDDTFEFFWDLTGINDNAPIPPAGATSELKAVLYSGNSACSSDTEAVSINNNDMPQQGPPQAETVEIIDPANGEQMGFYRQENGTTRGVMHVKASAATTFIHAKYSISAPGTEPVWKDCSTEPYDSDAGATTAGSPVTCTLASTDQGESVTAVAAIANNSPEPAEGDSGFDASSDAHRVDA